MYSMMRPGLVGHSMGAATIAQAVGQHRNVSRGVVLEDPAWSEPTDEEIGAIRELRAGYLATWRQWVVDLTAKSRAEALTQRRVEEPTWSPVDVETSLEGRFDFQLDLFDHYPLQRSPWRHLVAEFDCPALLVIGDRPDRGAIISRELAEQTAELNPGLRWAQIVDAGHHPKYDQFDQYRDAVVTFLGSLI
jgi:N-formylmaleamate deformylase